MTNTIKIGLVEDQLLFREGMKVILTQSAKNKFEVVFQSADGYSVIEKLNKNTVIPDVMLVDMSLPPTAEKKEFSGLQVTEALLKNYPKIKILILSVHNDDTFIAQMIQHGAHGYLAKDSDPEEVFFAIESIFRKGTYINEQTLMAIQGRMGKKSIQHKIKIDITKREEEILQLVCQQYTAEEIAQKLFISVKTVNGHRNNLLLKTGSKNVTGLVLYAIKNNIIQVF
jgi:two-component system response regulator NreC